MERFECLNCKSIHTVPEGVMRSGNYACYCGCTEFKMVIGRKSYDHTRWKKKLQKASMSAEKDEFYGIL